MLIDESKRKNYHINNNFKKPKILWKNLKNITLLGNTRAESIPDHINDPDKISDYFHTLPSCKSVDFNKDEIKRPTIQNPLDLKLTTDADVIKIINNITTNSSGQDGLTIKMIRLTLPKTLSIITAIINRSIATHTFPAQWKKALIRPIPKKTIIDNVKDLRPISILPVLSKVLEKVVLKQITDYLDANNITPKYQSGFRRSHGAETALLHVTDDLTEASDMGLSSILVLLDYTRAFDCLDPNVLLAKLSLYGFSANTCKWFETY